MKFVLYCLFIVGAPALRFQKSQSQRTTGNIDSGNLEDPNVWSHLVASFPEKEVVLMAGSIEVMLDIVRTVSNLKSVGVKNMFVLADRQDTCDQINGVMDMTGVQCRWSSFRDEQGVQAGLNDCEGKTGRIYLQRKYYMARLAVDHEFSVMGTDLDVVYVKNPFEVFKGSPTLNQYEMIFQSDNPVANGGIVYARKGPKSPGTAFILNRVWQGIDNFRGEAGLTRNGMSNSVFKKQPNLKVLASSEAGVRGCGWGEEQSMLQNTVLDAAFGHITNCHVWKEMHVRGWDLPVPNKKLCEDIDWENKGVPNVTFTKVRDPSVFKSDSVDDVGKSFQVYDAATPGGPANTVLQASQNLLSYSQNFVVELEKLHAKRCASHDTSPIQYPAVMFHMADVFPKDLRSTVLENYGSKIILGDHDCNTPSNFEKLSCIWDRAC